MAVRRKKPSQASYLDEFQPAKPEEGQGGDTMALLRTKSEPQPEVPETAPKPPKQAAPARPKKTKITLYFREEVLQEIRQCVLDLGGDDLEPSSVSAFTEEALQAHLEKLRAAHNKGKPWKLRKKRLPPGPQGGGQPRGQGE